MHACTFTRSCVIACSPHMGGGVLPVPPQQLAGHHEEKKKKKKKKKKKNQGRSPLLGIGTYTGARWSRVIAVLLELPSEDHSQSVVPVPCVWTLQLGAATFAAAATRLDGDGATCALAPARGRLLESDANRWAIGGRQTAVRRLARAVIAVAAATLQSSRGCAAKGWRGRRFSAAARVTHGTAGEPTAHAQVDCA